MNFSTFEATKRYAQKFVPSRWGEGKKNVHHQRPFRPVYTSNSHCGLDKLLHLLS